MTKVLVDIDGVLNPFLSSDLVGRGFSRVSEGWAEWMIHPQHGDWLREIAQHAEIVWATSWEVESSALSRMFLLGNIPSIHFARVSRGDTWKLSGVQEYARDIDEPIVWIDDELGSDAENWAEQREDTLLIRCDPSVGFIEEQYATVLNFVRGIAR